LLIYRQAIREKRKMRRFAYIFFVALFTFILPGGLHANVNGTALKDYPRQSTLKNSLDVQQLNLLGEIFLLPETMEQPEEAAKIISRVGQLPESMLKKIISNGINMVLFEGKLTDNPSAQDLKGITPRGYPSGKTWDDVPGVGGSKLVLVKIGNSAKGVSHGSVNLELHELAHSLDRHVYGMIREDERFLEIWKEESPYVFPGRSYMLDYPEEYFAETFAMYYLGGEYRELLQETANETYLFIKGLQ
jgi:hypothetical protein